MPIRVEYRDKFSNISTSDFDTLDDALDYVATYKFRYDDVEIYEVRYSDVYSLMKEKTGG